MTAPETRLETRLERALEKAAGDPGLRGIVARVERPADGFAWTGATGEAVDRPFFIASTTKLYTSALVLQLVGRGALALDDRLVDRVDRGLVAALHVRGGVD
ncbi:MAG TPA: serine hydrolase, partial [Candidatus Limnocylindrales bacterium]|nr:serine hydrolase [Candidatus Limnocylindrales bacterium]